MSISSVGGVSSSPFSNFSQHNPSQSNPWESPSVSGADASQQLNGKQNPSSQNNQMMQMMMMLLMMLMQAMQQQQQQQDGQQQSGQQPQTRTRPSSQGQPQQQNPNSQLNGLTGIVQMMTQMMESVTPMLESLSGGNQSSNLSATPSASSFASQLGSTGQGGF